MNTLINSTTNNNTLPAIQNHDDLKQAVDAKELYKSLGLNNTHWSRWASKNIESNPFAIEGLDYEGFAIMASGNNTRNYLLSIDFAKKLAMQVRTEEGEQVRDYFLECEDRAKQVANPQPVLPANYLEALEALVRTEKQKQEVTQQLELAQYKATIDAPKVEMFDLMIDKKTLKSVSAVAKDHGLSAQALNKALNKCQNMYDKRSSIKNQFITKIIQDGDGRTVLDNGGRPISMFTIKGEAKLIEKVLYTEQAKDLFEEHYKKTPKKLEEYRKKYEAIHEARSNNKAPNLARIEHTQATINTINNLLKK